MSIELVPTRLRRVRIDHGWSKAELGRRTGMQAPTIGWIESGRFIPYDSQLGKLASALGVEDAESLLEPEEVAR